jgi:arsenate reductase
MMTILHNPRCGKSRNAVSFLESLNLEFEVRNYQTEPLDVEEIRHLLKKLNMKAIDIVRTKEPLWKELPENEKKDELSIIRSIVKHPILLERPIIIQENKAIVGRTQEQLESIKSFV